MTYYDYTDDEIINVVKCKIQEIIGVSYDELLNISNKIKKIYNFYNVRFDVNSYIDRYNAVYYDLKEPQSLSEEYIRRLSIVSNMCNRVEKGNSHYQDLLFFMSLAHVINWYLIDIRSLWNIEHEKSNNLIAIQVEDIIYDYYKLFVLIYLDLTECVIHNFSYLPTTSYKDEIDKILVKIIYD